MQCARLRKVKYFYGGLFVNKIGEIRSKKKKKKEYVSTSISLPRK